MVSKIINIPAAVRGFCSSSCPFYVSRSGLEPDYCSMDWSLNYDMNDHFDGDGFDASKPKGMKPTNDCPGYGYYWLQRVEYFGNKSVARKKNEQ